jgi:hypothetical protein
MIPETPAAGRFHGIDFHVNRGVLDGEVLTLSDTSTDTNRAFVIHFRPDDLNATANHTFYISTNDIANIPEIKLVTHVKNSSGAENVIFKRGYSLQWQLGVRSKNKIPLKIYLCLPDAQKSFLAGTFKVTVKKDKSPQTVADN